MDLFDRNDQKISKRIIAENAVAFAFLNRMAIVPGHVLICPKRVVANREGLSFAEWEGILQLNELVCLKLKQYLGAEGFNFAWNEVVGLKDIITFQGKSVEELENAFKESIEDYLTWCKERGERPEKTFSGTFNLRISPDLHAKLALQAKTMGLSLNSFVAEKLRFAIN